MGANREFVHDGIPVTYKTRPARGDRRHLVVIFSGFRRLGTYDFDGSVSSGLRGNILWIQDQFYDNYAYYLSKDSDYKIRDAVHALIEQVRLDLGLDKSQCTMAGFSKGGSAALYFGINYNYGAIVTTVPQMHIGSYVYNNWPKAFGSMTLSGSESEREGLDKLLPDLVKTDSITARNIYLFSSEADAQYPFEIEPYLELFAKYENFNFVLTDTPLVTEHKMVTRYNVPLILATLSALIEGVAPRYGLVRNGSRNQQSALPAPSIGDVQRRKELVSGLTSAPIVDGRLYFEGYGFIKGYRASRYGDVTWQIHFDSDVGRQSYCGGGITTPELSNTFYEAEYCDYSIAGFASMARRGMELEGLPDGLYEAQLEVTHAGTTVEGQVTSSNAFEAWGETTSSIVGIRSSSVGTTLVKRPAIGPTPQDAYFKEIRHWVKGSNFHIEGYFAILGFEAPRYSDISYYLVCVDVADEANSSVIRTAAAHRDDVSERLGDGWGDYSKSYFATPRYQGVDLSVLDPGSYAAYITVRFGRVVFSNILSSKITVTGHYANGSELLSVGVIGSCISRDNFSSAVIPNWKKYFAFHGGQYQMAFVSLMADAVAIPPMGFGDLDAHSANATVRDFTKAYLSELEDGAPDVILLDFLADARYGCLVHDGSLVTNNKWKLQKSDFYLGLTETQIVSMEDGEGEAYLELFREAVSKFEKFRAEFLPSTKIVINSARAVGSHIDGNKKVAYSADYVRKLNRRLDALEAVYLEEAPGTPVLENMMDGVISSKTHPWGPGQVHYEELFYRRFQNALKSACDYSTVIKFG